MPPAGSLIGRALERLGRGGRERRILLLETSVRVSHAVGSMLDPVEVFREVYHQVRAVLPVDAFFVAIADDTRSRLHYRFLVDESRELEPTERELAGTLAGRCIETGAAILLRDATRDRERLGLPRQPWGTVQERSVMVAPLRVRGQVIGALSAQSVNVDAYGRDDLDLIVDIAQEAAFAIERADLHARTVALSRALFDLHRLGADLVIQRDVGTLARRLESAASELLRARAVVYLDNGGEALERASGEGDPPGVPPTVAKIGTAGGHAMRSGEAIEVTSSEQLPESSRRLMEEGGSKALYIQPLRAGGTAVGVLYVSWDRPHAFSDDERELIGVIAGIGATAMRSLRLYEELEDAYLSTVATLTATTQAREGYREDHLRQVAADAVALGDRLGLPEDVLRTLRYAALFHSIGKIAVPASILGKRGALTREETAVLREHPVVGAQIVGSIRSLGDVAPVVRHATEHWDGSGYPDGLAGEAIPRLARILAVAIAFRAMVVERPYREALSVEESLEELRKGAGSRYDPALVEQFTQMIEARGAVERAEQEARGALELSILAELTPEFHALLDLQSLLDRVLGLLEKRMPGRRLGIYLTEAGTGDLLLRAKAGGWPAHGHLRIPRGRGVSGWVSENARAQIVDDVRLDARWLPMGDDTRSALAVPLVSAGHSLGVMVLLHPGTAHFTRRDLTLMQAVAAQLAAAVEVAGLHERLKVAASTDGLTGVHNHRYFWDRLEEEVARAERRTTPLSVAYFDIDGLKRVNDSHGHLAGDAVLRAVGRVIAENVRAEDVPARYGGDEFAVVMPETAREEAENAVRRLMERIDAAAVDVEGVEMPRRSWGVASYPEDGRTAKDLVETADSRAYARKRATR